MPPTIHSVGIDLGTTYSCISYLSPQGQPITLPNEEGELTTHARQLGAKAPDSKYSGSDSAHCLLRNSGATTVERPSEKPCGLVPDENVASVPGIPE